jgi:hypothetical protein
MYAVTSNNIDKQQVEEIQKLGREGDKMIFYFKSFCA